MLVVAYGLLQERDRAGLEDERRFRNMRVRSGPHLELAEMDRAPTQVDDCGMTPVSHRACMQRRSVQETRAAMRARAAAHDRASAAFRGLLRETASHQAREHERLAASWRMMEARVSGVDEIGYLTISRTGAQLFFKLMSRGYEHAPTVLTSKIL